MDFTWDYFNFLKQLILNLYSLVLRTILNLYLFLTKHVPWKIFLCIYSHYLLVQIIYAIHRKWSLRNLRIVQKSNYVKHSIKNSATAKKINGLSCLVSLYLHLKAGFFTFHVLWLKSNLKFLDFRIVFLNFIYWYIKYVVFEKEL